MREVSDFGFILLYGVDGVDVDAVRSKKFC